MNTAKLGVLMIVGLLLVVTGCQEGIIGRVVPADKRVSLAESGPQTGSWQTFDYSMNYRYIYNLSKGGAGGDLEFSASLEKSSGGLDSLTIWLLLLDGDGRILQMESVYDSGYKQRRMNSSFSTTVKTPPETAGISFTHTAQISRGHK